ncbi:MAG: hypothetical protein ACREDO_03490 [Methyloceanibacter sp.]
MFIIGVLTTILVVGTQESSRLNNVIVAINVAIVLLFVIASGAGDGRLAGSDLSAAARCDRACDLFLYGLRHSTPAGASPTPATRRRSPS